MHKYERPSPALPLPKQKQFDPLSSFITFKQSVRTMFIIVLKVLIHITQETLISQNQ